MRLPLLVLAAFAAFVPTRRVAAQASPDDAAPVVATVQRLFDAMARRDTVGLRAVLVRGAQFVALADGAPSAAGPRVQGDSAFVQLVGKSAQRLLERMWAPIVRVQGRIATVWTPYDFHVDGRWSHCGIDTVTLLRTSDEWQVAAIIYTVQRTGCAPSPLGAPA